MKKGYKWLLGVILLGVAFSLDSIIMAWAESIRNPTLDSAMKGFVYIGHEAFILVFLTLILYRYRKKFVVPWWITFFVSILCVFVLKLIFARERPDTITSLIVEDGFSFPSGHATVSFSSLPIIYRCFKKEKKFWLTYVLLVAFSRIYLGVHYLSDVVAGALLGTLIGVLVLKFYRKH